MQRRQEKDSYTLKSSSPKRRGREKLDLPTPRETPVGKGFTCEVRTLLTVGGAVQGEGRKDHYFSKEPKGNQSLEQPGPCEIKGRMFTWGCRGGP